VPVVTRLSPAVTGDAPAKHAAMSTRISSRVAASGPSSWRNDRPVAQHQALVARVVFEFEFEAVGSTDIEARNLCAEVVYRLTVVTRLARTPGRTAGGSGATSTSPTTQGARRTHPVDPVALRSDVARG
jgi:hypothetical protein